MADIQPPPTYAEVVLVDEQTKRAKFNPIWLKWFVDLAQTLNDSGGTSLNHNDLDNIQGGSASERYHLTAAQQGDVLAIVALAAGMLAKTAANTYAARTITGTANQIVVANGGGVAGNPTLTLAIGDLLVGTWTPTLTNVANLDGSTAYLSTYIRAGSFVLAFGKVDVDPTAAATPTQLGISLPVASNFANDFECAGVAFASGVAGQGAAIVGDAANNRAEMQWVSGDTTNQPMFWLFGYRIIA